MKQYCLSVLAAGCLAAPAMAGDLIVGFGADDAFAQTDASAGALVVEYRARPFYSGKTAEYAIGAAAQVDGDADIWSGIGVTAIWALSDRWFVEGSLMPGYYDMGSDGTDLGGNFQFRSLIGVGYRLDSGGRVSLSVDHKSNASTRSHNPGSETVALRHAFPL